MQDLNPYLPRPPQRVQLNSVLKTSNAEVMAQADYRNVPFLARFITPTGQLTPRRRTKLQQKVHRHLCRQVRLEENRL